MNEKIIKEHEKIFEEMEKELEMFVRKHKKAEFIDGTEKDILAKEMLKMIIMAQSGAFEPDKH